jgi:protein-tyrosine phosphatase
MNDVVADVSSMSDAARAGEQIAIASLPNLRDVGGWTTRAGDRVRRGLAYRSVELARLTDTDMAVVAVLGLRTVYDLRTASERALEPDRLPDGAELVVADVLADSADAAPAELAGLLSDPATAQARLGDGKAEAIFAQGYRQIVSLPSALDAYRSLYTGLADPARRPALFHCTTGKDRTGWASAALLSLLGVERDLVLQEYLLTNDELVPALEPIFDQFEAAGGDRALLLPILGVHASYLQAAFDELDARYGTIERYFSEGLGLDRSAQDALRAEFLTTGAGHG